MSSKEHERFIVGIAFLIIALCVVAIFLLDLRKKQLQKSPEVLKARLNRGLWKIDKLGKTSDLETKEYQVAWWKLVSAGVMICGLILSIGIKILPLLQILLIIAGAFSIWIAFLTYFWYKYVINQEDTPEKVNESDESTDKEGSDWTSKTKDSKSELDNRLPVTIVTGFLGSGKTTLIKKILNNTKGLKILIIENEIGDEGIDHKLLMQHTAKEEIILMNNGCICCTVRKDLLTTFHKMFANEAFAKLDWIIIETTGLADPAPLIQALYMDPLCQTRLRLDCVLSIVDALHFLIHMESPSNGIHGGKVSEAILQISYADRIILNKCDLIDEETQKKLLNHLKTIHPTAPVYPCSYGSIDLSEVLNIRAFDPKCNFAMLPETLISYQSNDQNQSMRSFLPLDQKGNLIKKVSSKLKRVNVDMRSSSQSSVVTVCLQCTDSPLDLHKFNLWISQLMQHDGKNIYRMKGILWMDGFEEQFVIQGIHMILDGERGMQWKEDEERKSVLVFIGLEIVEKVLLDGFNECRVVR